MQEQQAVLAGSTSHCLTHSHILASLLLPTCSVFFPSVVSSLFSIFSCFTGDKGDSGAADVAWLGLPASLSFGRPGDWWQMDMDQQCFQGSHRVLALALGVPGLLLVAAGIPAACAWWLSYNRHLLQEPQFKACWWVERG